MRLRRIDLRPAIRHAPRLRERERPCRERADARAEEVRGEERLAVRGPGERPRLARRRHRRGHRQRCRVDLRDLVVLCAGDVDLRVPRADEHADRLRADRDGPFDRPLRCVDRVEPTRALTCDVQRGSRRIERERARPDGGIEAARRRIDRGRRAREQDFAGDRSRREVDEADAVRVRMNDEQARAVGAHGERPGVRLRAARRRRRRVAGRGRTERARGAGEDEGRAGRRPRRRPWMFIARCTA